MVQRVGSGAELNNGLSESLGAKIEKLPGVAVAMGGLVDMVSFPDNDLMNVLINGWPIGSPLFQELDNKDPKNPSLVGRLPTAQDHKKVLLGKVLASNLGVKVGDKIPMYGDQVEVIGIFDSSQVYESGSIAIPLHDLQQFMNRPHQVTGYIVRSNIPKDNTPEHQAALSSSPDKSKRSSPGSPPSRRTISSRTSGRSNSAVPWPGPPRQSPCSSARSAC